MNIKSKQMLQLFYGFIILLFLGTTLAWSVFLVPVETTYGWTRSQTSLAATVSTMAFSIGAILTGILCKKYSFSTILKIAAVLLFTGFIFTSFIQPGSSVLLLYLTYGILVGTSAGMGYNCVLSVCPLWMANKPATANGILLMGYALSTAIFAPVINSLIISTNNVALVFKILGIVCGIGVMFFAFFVRIPEPNELDELPQMNRQAGKKTYNVITADMIKMPLFWVFYLLTVLLPGVGMAFINHNSPIIVELGATPTYAAFVVSLCMLCNGLARLIFGFVYDKLGVKKSVMVVITIFTIAVTTILLAYQMGSVLLYVVGVCALLTGFGFNATSMPSLLREIFGHRTFSLNYSILSTDAFITAWFATVVGMMQTSSGNYGSSIFVLTIIIYIAIAVVALFFVLLNKEMKKRNQSHQ